MQYTGRMVVEPVGVGDRSRAEARCIFPRASGCGIQSLTQAEVTRFCWHQLSNTQWYSLGLSKRFTVQARQEGVGSDRQRMNGMVCMRCSGDIFGQQRCSSSHIEDVAATSAPAGWYSPWDRPISSNPATHVSRLTTQSCINCRLSCRTLHE